VGDNEEAVLTVSIKLGIFLDDLVPGRLSKFGTGLLGRPGILGDNKLSVLTPTPREEIPRMRRLHVMLQLPWLRIAIVATAYCKGSLVIELNSLARGT
jgi:hypothetical protein